MPEDVGCGASFAIEYWREIVCLACVDWVGLHVAVLWQRDCCSICRAALFGIDDVKYVRVVANRGLGEGREPFKQASHTNAEVRMGANAVRIAMSLLGVGEA